MVSPNWLSVREVMKVLGVSDSYITRLCRAGVLNAKQIGVTWIVDPVSLRSYAERRNRTPGPKLKQPNAVTLAAIEELESGGGERFDTVQEAIAWLRSDD